ncbi:DUF2288 domain-containing protein [Spirulina subsalsa FACHB-351]|uniref:DUF2288 domain-containing protein n=1 Tax=Spirulina subsalsa FACHB-351 TaxID=234711 RepID=A0ABT3L503_9CYAN|nr:DUF2288 domain-containing protein [Spirulina subsalsa]MCW6036576.1 DUF2288 domain-containing protein [Spirulina subsalsa FACHB-351]
MPDDLKTTLTESIDQASWEWLLPHVKRDAVLMVSDDLDLVEVGYAIASDQVQLVQTWIDSQLIHKPWTEQISDWNGQPQIRFNALIIQPFVLVQPIP